MELEVSKHGAAQDPHSLVCISVSFATLVVICHSGIFSKVRKKNIKELENLVLCIFTDVFFYSHFLEFIFCPSIDLCEVVDNLYWN